jgi:hypothetical protein
MSPKSLGQLALAAEGLMPAAISYTVDHETLCGG